MTFPGVPHARLAAADRHRLAATFDDAADVYDRARPGFPAVALDWILPAGAGEVLDLGAGTGKLTRSLVARGLTVTAIDPSPNMLARLREHLPTIDSRLGSAEAIDLPDASMDAVLVGSAFHWFDRPAADAEIARVLRPGGVAGLLWNRRDPASSSFNAFDAASVAASHSMGRAVEHLRPERNSSVELDRHFFGPTERGDFEHSQELSIDGVLELISSRSYVIAMHDDDRRDLLATIRRRIEAEVPAGELIEVGYTTIALRAERAIPAG
ncbi:methyltransferase family protein [Jatrophihabitans sp. GAS493]|uniref:class I SAM-dependent methyltransferase n=1 Tax=Jatrophihabitans sp. GAS493 TaxID=1907575 RepID=UPI000BC033AB|nr:class I SAM-dependent methyltransferase [Jatrophihabitans sp. GAS493]SOD70548.1 methyltransferase family protein [Jatrophihabitans sp. GAS493]